MDSSANSLQWPGSLRIHVCSSHLGTRQVSLSQALILDEPVRLEHPMGYLTAPMIMKAAAVLQYIFDMEGGISKEEWGDVVFDGLPLAGKWMAALEKCAHDPSPGFYLTGETAFMQIPEALGERAAPGPIFGLFEPIRQRLGADSKALRLPTRRMQRICPGCAAIGLYLNHHFSKEKAQFWGTGPMRGALVWLVRLDTEQTPAGARRTMLANVRYRDSRSWMPPEPLPWLPDRPGFNGLDSNGQPPFERSLLLQESMAAPANLQLPLIRGIRLVQPAKVLDRCGCCGQEDREFFSSYRIVPEPALFGSLSASTQKALGGAKSKVLARMLMPEARHPYLGYRKVEDQEKVHRPLFSDRTLSDVKHTQPTWVTLADLLADDAARPDILRQYAIALHSRDRPVRVKAQLRLDISLFAVTFVSGTNPSIRAIINDRYGFSASALADTISGKIGAAIAGIRRTIEGCVIRSWLEAAILLEYRARQSAGRVEGFEVCLPPKKQILTLQKHLRGNGILHSMANRVWDSAYEHVSTWLDNPELLSGEKGAVIVNKANQALISEAAWLWQDYLDVYARDRIDLASLFLGYEAKDTYSRLVNKHLKAIQGQK